MIIARQFFPLGNDTAAFLAALATFAAGFVVRPFGALVFGRLGDLVGRKYTFLVTLLLMGGSTFSIGLVPGYAKIGMAAPIIILVLRLLQGLALGGEYGGAATYVAEHAPEGRRGYYTSFIQTTATLGFFLSLGVILLTRRQLGVEAFNDWGWRVPFLISALLIGVSIFIRLRMAESPMFTKIKTEGNISKNPLRESFGNKENLKLVLLALFGVVMGQGVVWYTGQFYAQTFIERTCGVEFEQTRFILCIAILLATPFFVVFGAWSDRIGRVKIMMAGLFLAVLCYRPLYQQIFNITDTSTKMEVPALFAQKTNLSISQQGDTTLLTTTWRGYTDGTTLKTEEKRALTQGSSVEKTKVLWINSSAFWQIMLLIFIQIIFVTMVYGPIAAFLVELFPTKIRYTSMSLPYHIGNGIFGGLTPFIATRFFDISKNSDGSGGDPFVGLWYPIGVGAVCLLIGILYFFKNSLRRAAGILWMVLAFGVVLGLIVLAIRELTVHATIDNKMFWYVILPIFTPIMAGMGLFGWYAWRGAYDE
jgi:MHS family proline/betaine transporter-like MFS transporter